MGRARSPLFAIGLLFAVLCVGGCAEPAGDAAGITEEPLSFRRRPTPVIFDGDMGFDDVAALAYLCEQHRAGEIELVAVSVANNGVGFPGSAIRHARCVLEACGAGDVPVADGTPLGVNEVAIELRGAMEVVLGGAFAECSAGVEPGASTAPELIAATLRREGRATIISMGPLTNVSEAFAANRWLPLRVQRLVSMGGAFDVPGNLFGAQLEVFDNTQEVNIWADPAAADHVWESLLPGTAWIVPLDATNDVPISADYVAAIAADRTTAAAEIVHTVMQQPIMQFGVSLGGFYWWDPLTAVSLTDRRVTDFELARIDVVQDGASAGRTVRARRGALVHIGVGADRERFETLFLDGLNGR